MRHLDYALLLIIAWGLLAAGAVEPWAYRPLALAAAFIGGAALLASRGANKPGWALLAGFGLLAGAVLVQLVPIRRPLILRHSPSTDAFLQRAGSGYKGMLWGDPPPTHSLSVNPDATLVGLLLLCAFAALLVGAARGLTSRQIRTLAAGLPLLGGVAAVLVIAQNVGSPGQGYLDRDRLTGWLLMAFPLGLYHSYAARRGGAARPAPSALPTALVTFPASLMAAALAWMAWNGLTSMTGGETTAVWGSWNDTWTLIRDFRPAGTGLNTFGTAMMVFQPMLLPTTGYNSYLQFAAEGGLLLVVPATIVLGLFIWQVLRRFADRSDDDEMRLIRAAAVAGLVLVLLYELVGLSLQAPGNAALFAVLGGVAIARP
jgi:hypothetical protein